jgi:hypothetical protein
MLSSYFLLKRPTILDLEMTTDVTGADHMLCMVTIIADGECGARCHISFAQTTLVYITDDARGLH